MVEVSLTGLQMGGGGVDRVASDFGKFRCTLRKGLLIANGAFVRHSASLFRWAESVLSFPHACVDNDTLIRKT